MASGWWDNSGAISGCVAAYRAVGAASQAASYINLQNPGTYDAAAGVAPTWDASTGWSFNGSTQYLTTGLTPANDQGWSMLVRFANVQTNGNPWSVGAGQGPYFVIAPQFIANNLMVIGNGDFITTPYLVTGTAGFAGNKAYNGGSQVGGTIATSAGTFAALRIGADADGGAKHKGDILAVVVYNSVLSAGNVATLTTLMNALAVDAAKGLPIIAHHHRAVFGG